MEQPHQNMAELVFLTSTEPNAQPGEWKMVLPDDVPAALKEPEVIGQLVDPHNVAYCAETALWYRCEKTADIEEAYRQTQGAKIIQLRR